MKTEDIINLDCRKEESQEIIQKVLRKIKPLSRYPDGCDIPFEAIEKAITVMCKKYCLRIKELVPDIWSNKNNIIWRAVIINDTNLETVELVYGITLYEVFAKITIRIYAEVRKGIKTRDK